MPTKGQKAASMEAAFAAAQRIAEAYLAVRGGAEANKKPACLQMPIAAI